MAAENNNMMQMNTFSGGMNTDLADSALKTDQYRSALNMRYLTNNEGNAGELTVVEGSKLLKVFDGEIFESTTVDKYGVVFLRNHDGISIGRFELSEKQSDPINPVLIFGPCKDWNIKNKLSIVGRKENEDNIKLYIADGEHQIIIIDLFPQTVFTSIKQIVSNTDVALEPPVISKITNGSLKAGMNQYSYQLYSRYKQSTDISPLTRPISIVNSRGNGIFYGSQSGKTTNMGIQLEFKNIVDSPYDTIKIYRIHYNDIGTSPEVHVIYEGNITDSFTFLDNSERTLGQITIEEYNAQTGVHIIPKIIESKNDYLFAAQIKELQSSDDSFKDINTVSISFDATTKTVNGNLVWNQEPGLFNYKSDKNVLQGKTINDLKGANGKWELFDSATKSCDCHNPATDVEYNVTKPYNTNYDFPLDDTKTKKLTGYNFVAMSGSAKDVGAIYGGTGKHVDWKFIVTTLPIDSNDSFSYKSNITFGTQWTAIRRDYHNTNALDFKKYYINSFGDWIHAGSITKPSGREGYTYQDPIIAASLKSLQRGEVYRYGVIFTNSKNQTSPVKWIADIRVPEICTKGFESFQCNYKGCELVANPLGIEFTLHDLDDRDITKYEIVRCNRTSNDMTIVSQGVISRPVKRRFKDDQDPYNVPYTPSGFITSNRLNLYGKNASYVFDEVPSNPDLQEADNFSNTELYQFISPEAVLLPNYTKDIIKKSNVKINTLSYLFSGNGFGYHYDKLAYFFNQESSYMDGAVKRYVDYINNTGFRDISVTKAIVKSEEKQNQIRKKIDIVTDQYGRNPTLFNNIGTYDLVCSFLLGERQLQHESTVGRNGNFDNSDFAITPPQTSGNRKDRDIGKSWYKAQLKSFQYFKLYNQSTDVFINHHLVADPSSWGVASKNGLNTTATGFVANKSFTFNTCNIKNVKEVKGLKWNEYSKKDSSNNVSLNYIDQINVVGNYNFCNWVSMGTYNQPPSSIKQNKNTIKYEQETQLNGPGGSCLLFTLDNKWKYAYSNYGSADSFPLADTVGCGSVMGVDLANINLNGDVFRKHFNSTDLELEKSSDSDFRIVQHKGGDTRLIPGSVFGTYLCNIVKSSVPYGGGTQTAIDNSIYYSYSDIFKYNKGSVNKVNIFDGDVFILPFEYTSLHKFYNNDAENAFTSNITYAIPVETSINLEYTAGYEFSRNLDDGDITWLQEEPSAILSIHQQQDPQYVYNTAYSSVPNTQLHFSKLRLNVKNTETFNYRCRFSNKKENGELQDSWVTFLAANYTDVDPNYGKITELKTYRNNLMFFQEKAFGQFSVNERTTITDNNSQQLLLGSGGVLDRYDYITTDNGMRDNHFSDVTTSTALYWWDADKRNICQYAEGQGYYVISKMKGVQSLLDSMGDASTILTNPHITVDKKYDEVIFYIYDGGWTDRNSLIYNEKQQLFSSEYTIRPKASIQYYNKLLLAENYKLYEWNTKDTVKTLNGNSFYAGVKYVINDVYQNVKVFDNVLFGGEFNTKNYDSIHWQFDTKGQISLLSDGQYISNRYYDYRFAIPRDMNRQGEGFGNRMRGKTMECSAMVIPNSSNFSLQYIITKYRTLWS